MKIGSINFTSFPVILAPMEGVTDMPFRILCRQMGADVVFSEFVASEALVRNVDKSIQKVRFDEQERPVAIQIFGADVPTLVKAAEIALEHEPDILDINCGCPVKKVVAKGAGAAMMKEPQKIIDAVSKIVKISNKPVTVKTRTGWDSGSINVMEIAERLQDTGIAALTIHGRTRSQMYSGEADWNIIARVKNNPKIKMPIIGNGDIDSAQKAATMIQKSGVDGVMIGRAAIGNPWIFREIKHYLTSGIIEPKPTMPERVKMCKQHLKMSVEYKGERLTIMEMRHHYPHYFKAVRNFKMYKLQLLQAASLEEVYNILDEVAEL